MAPPHPLRRISTGSLSSLARSQDRQHTSPSGLEFLHPALTELADEAATLSTNIARLNELHDALGTFNEAFAGWMYALKMNAFCVEWPVAPSELSFQRLPNLAPPRPPTPTSAPSALSAASSAPSHNLADMTYATAASLDDIPPPKPAAKKVVKKVANGPAKKKRELEVAAYIDTLPLDYRGRDPAMRLAMEKIINMLLDNPSGLGIKDMVSPPDLPQAKVNKHLIALVTKKLVTKSSARGETVTYRWIGV